MAETTTPAVEPRTEAGKRLLERIAENERLSLNGARLAEYVPAILAIEAEAAALPGQKFVGSSGRQTLGFHASAATPPADDTLLREAAQAVLDEAEPDEDPEGQYVDLLVPYTAMDALQQALRAALHPPVEAGEPEPKHEGPHFIGEFEAPDPVECAICGDYSSQGVEVHEVCLDMLSRMAKDPTEPAATPPADADDTLLRRIETIRDRYHATTWAYDPIFEEVLAALRAEPEARGLAADEAPNGDIPRVAPDGDIEARGPEAELYVTAHRHGVRCGIEAAGLGVTECEHVGSWVLTRTGPFEDDPEPVVTDAESGADHAEWVTRHYRHTHPPVRPALAAPAPDTLDVERLAQALVFDSDTNPAAPDRLWNLLNGDLQGVYRKRAAKVAAEYARLAATEPTEEQPR